MTNTGSHLQGPDENGHRLTSFSSSRPWWGRGGRHEWLETSIGLHEETTFREDWRLQGLSTELEDEGQGNLSVLLCFLYSCPCGFVALENFGESKLIERDNRCAWSCKFCLVMDAILTSTKSCIWVYGLLLTCNIHVHIRLYLRSKIWVILHSVLCCSGKTVVNVFFNFNLQDLYCLLLYFMTSSPLK